MPSYTNTILTWNDASTCSPKCLNIGNATVQTDASLIPIIGGWPSTEKTTFLKLQQKFSLSESDVTTGGEVFSGNRNMDWYTRHKETFLQEIEQQIMGNWTIDTICGTSGTTVNIDVPPPPRRHGGIYNVRGRKRDSLHRPQANEQKARRLLQRLIGFQRYARYIRDGFVSYRGTSGRVYQIFPGQTHMRVWFKGQRVEDLCLCIKDYSIPPTDSVVMRLLMLEHSEAEFREQANISRAATKTDQEIIDESIASIRAMPGQVRALAG